MDWFEEVLKRFIDEVRDDRIEIYNEFSLQHELGIALRNSCPYWNVYFEKNTEEYFHRKDMVKKEIDLSVIDKNALKENEKFVLAVELKFPRNGQYPESMFSFCKDIRFCEELKAAGFKQTKVLIFSEDSNFYEGRKKDGIYAYFRGNKPITGRIKKPTGASDEFVEISGVYSPRWVMIKDPLQYLKIDI